MFKVLFLLFIAMPIVEIMVLMKVGSIFGVLPTIALVILTAWAGAAMVRQQGLATFQSVQGKLNQGELPSDEIVAALLLLVAGVMLLTPGFITDGFGLLLLWPVSRAKIVKMLQKHFVVAQSRRGNVFEGQFTSHSFHQQSSFDEPKVSHDKHTIDGEFERKE
ncbi:FxsA family protein [Thalassomonas sp. M1454]|uniref:FxsA family protein n=1 Tax=Thalassomonas sp. M1454 TaxID=2594477 RepID=UPI00117E9E37|nr:FxsA family protein [Thalassomonas sp. M1454]TRX53146.1 FxsA family protein [Thalassomonas sp. M1454]